MPGSCRDLFIAGIVRCIRIQHCACWTGRCQRTTARVGGAFCKGAKAFASTKTSAVVFRIGCGMGWRLPTYAFQEVAERGRTHSLPHQAWESWWLVNIRGELLICVSLQPVARLEKTVAANDPHELCRLLVKMGGSRLFSGGTRFTELTSLRRAKFTIRRRRSPNRAPATRMEFFCATETSRTA